MDADNRKRAEAILEEIVGPTPPTTTAHRMRSRVLERAASLELALDEVLSDALSKDAGAGFWLRSELFWRMPIRDRISQLGDLLEENDLDGRWPFLVPVLGRFFHLRNLLAHGFVQPVRLDEQVLRVATAKRGKRRVESFAVGDLTWLLHAVDVAQNDLVEVWAAVVPADRAWHEF